MTGVRGRAVLVCLLVVASGCSTFTPAETSKGSDQGVFRHIYVENADTEPHTVHVVVMHDGSIVYWTTRHIRGSQQNTHYGTIIAPPEITNTTRTYTVLLRIDNSTQGYRYTVDDDHQCYGFSAEILDDHEVRRAVTYFDASDCGTPNTTA